MDISWSVWVVVLLVAILIAVLLLFSELKRLSLRIDAIEVDRAWFANERHKQIESIQGDLSDLKYSLSDLSDFQKGTGRYLYDPDDPRLPTHIRDREGRDQ